MSDLERRMTRGVVEARAGEDNAARIGGYAAKFRTLSQNLGGFVETIERGFFDASRDEGYRGVMARYNHELLLGTTAAGSLRLSIDDTGLDYETDLLDDAESLRVHKLVQRGDVHQSSFAFYTIEDEWSMTEQGFPLRTLLRGKLVDVAPVDSPAYLDTSTGLRSLADKKELDLVEVRALADAGELGKLLSVPPVVVDLSGTQDSGSGAQGETRSAPVRLLALRRALEDETAD